jgi:hypothetical protein
MRVEPAPTSPACKKQGDAQKADGNNQERPYLRLLRGLGVHSINRLSTG